MAPSRIAGRPAGTGVSGAVHVRIGDGDRGPPGPGSEHEHWGVMRKYLIVTVVVLLAIAGAVAVGCGGDESAAGEYKWKSGEESVKDMTVVLSEDGVFTLKGMPAGTDVEQSIEGTWKQEGSTVTLTLGEGDEAESEVGEYKDDELVFDEIVWVKQ